MKKVSKKSDFADFREYSVLLSTRSTIRSILSGIFLLTLSLTIILIQNQTDVIYASPRKQATFEEVLPMLVFFFSCGYVWYYTCKASCIARKGIQLWIGNVRAVVAVGFVIIIIDYL